MEVFDARLKHPFSLIIAGSSQSGKTTWLVNLLLHADQLIDSTLEYIVVFIGTEHSPFLRLKSVFGDKLSCVGGLPESFDPYIDRNKRGLFIIDDLMRVATVDKNIGELFTKRGHHENISICLVLQNLFASGKERLTCQRSSHYIVLFRNPLDQSVTHIMAQRLEPARKKKMTDMLTYILLHHRYVFLDGKQDTLPGAKYRTDMFNEFFQRCFELL